MEKTIALLLLFILISCSTNGVIDRMAGHDSRPIWADEGQAFAIEDDQYISTSMLIVPDKINLNTGIEMAKINAKESLASSLAVRVTSFLKNERRITELQNVERTSKIITEAVQNDRLRITLIS